MGENVKPDDSHSAPDPVDTCEGVDLAGLCERIKHNRQLIDEISGRVQQILELLLHSTGPRLHPEGYAGRSILGHELGTGLTRIVGPGGAEVGKVFTTLNESTNEWTERYVIRADKLTDYVDNDTALDWKEKFSPPNSPSAADAARDAYIATLESPGPGSRSGNAVYKFLTPPSTESNTPGSSSTWTYRVRVKENGTWTNRGLMFRERASNTKDFRDYYLLEDDYEAHTTRDTIELDELPSSDSAYETDRKDFIENNYSTYSSGYFIEAIYTLAVD